MNPHLDFERYDETFEDAKLGFSVALSRNKRGLCSVRVEDVSVLSERRIVQGDVLLLVNGEAFEASDDASFRQNVVDRLTATARPVILTFAATGKGFGASSASSSSLASSSQEQQQRRKKVAIAEPRASHWRLGTAGWRLNSRRRTVDDSEIATLRVCLLKGENLVAKDRDFITRKRTASDPYAVVYVCGERIGQTKTCQKTLAPEWYEDFEAAVPAQSQELPVRIELFDYDVGNDDAMGEIKFDARGALPSSSSSKPRKSRWYDVKTTKQCKDATGRVEIAVHFRKPAPPMPKRREVDPRWAIKIHAGHDLCPGTGSKECVPDPFCVVETDAEGGRGVETFGVSSVVGRTSVRTKTADPEWNYVCEFDAPLDMLGFQHSPSSMSSSTSTSEKPRTPTFRERLSRRFLSHHSRRSAQNTDDDGSTTTTLGGGGPHARIKVYDQTTFTMSGGQKKAIGQVSFSLQGLLQKAEASDSTWSTPEWLPLMTLDGRKHKHHRKDHGAVLVSVALLAAHGRPLTVACCSMNCGNAAIEPLEALVPPFAQLKDFASVKDDDDTVVDVVVLGLQESTTSRMPGAGPRAVDGSQNNNNNTNDDENDLDASVLRSKQTSSLKKTLGGLMPGHEIVCEASRGQMRLFAFVRSPLAAGVHERRLAYENTGLAHVVANKGGIAFACTIAGASQTSVVIFSAHLAAHEGEAYRLRRNSDVQEIVRGCRSDLVRHSGSAQRSPVVDALDVDTQIDYSFFIGDLNYRVGDDLLDDNDDDDDSGPAGDSDDDDIGVWERDELSMEMAADRVFCGGWIAPTPTFPPTFKVVRGEPRCVYNKKRAPSWCDRVLYKGRDVGRVEMLAFDSVPAVLSSDHKPVRAVWRLHPAPLRPLARVTKWDLRNVDLVIDVEEPFDDDSSEGSSSTAKMRGRLWRRRNADPPPKLMIRALTTPRECLEAPCCASVAPAAWTATWSQCLHLNLTLEQGPGSRATLHLTVYDNRRRGVNNKILGAADIAVATVKSDISSSGSSIFRNIPIVRDTLIIGRISGAIQPG